MSEEFKPRVFDITKAQCLVNNEPIVDCGPDGFGITPGMENTMIVGLQGELGFNIDPSTAATGSVQVKSVSNSMKTLIELWNNQTVFVYSIKPKVNHEKVFGYKEMKIAHAIITKPPEWTTEGKESPNCTFTIGGYGFEIIPRD